MLVPLVLSLVVSAGNLPSIAVLDVRAPAGTDAQVVTALSSLLPVEAARHQLRVTSGSDLRAMLDLERQRQLIGCSESECAAELASALGTDWLLMTDLSNVGGQWLLAMSLLHNSQREPTVRTARKTTDTAALVDLATDAADELLRRFPLLERRTSVVRPLGFVVGGVGLAALAAGGLSGGLALMAFNDAKAAGLAGDASLFQSQREAAQGRMVAANVLYVAGAVGLAAGVLMVLLGGDSAPPVTIAPHLTADGAAVFVGWGL
ncbi:MAG: hypothetical protein GQE15_02975 [Archangiaceae bacterium]|nr:hypothetical protein [Archangiaceae bacterium]